MTAERYAWGRPLNNTSTVYGQKTRNNLFLLRNNSVNPRITSYGIDSNFIFLFYHKSILEIASPFVEFGGFPISKRFLNLSLFLFWLVLLDADQITRRYVTIMYSNSAHFTVSQMLNARFQPPSTTTETDHFDHQRKVTFADFPSHMFQNLLFQRRLCMPGSLRLTMGGNTREDSPNISSPGGENNRGKQTGKKEPQRRRTRTHV